MKKALAVCCVLTSSTVPASAADRYRLGGVYVGEATFSDHTETAVLRLPSGYEGYSSTMEFVLLERCFKQTVAFAIAPSVRRLIAETPPWVEDAEVSLSCSTSISKSGKRIAGDCELQAPSIKTGYGTRFVLVLGSLSGVEPSNPACD